MRKLLFLGVAAAASSTVPAMQFSAYGQTPLPFGVMGMPAQPQPFLGGNNIYNSEGSTPSIPQAPVPGGVVIHLNGRAVVEATGQGPSQPDRR